jgi:hypothetical protein
MHNATAHGRDATAAPKKGAQPFMPVTRYDAAESGDGFVRHPMV